MDKRFWIACGVLILAGCGGGGSSRAPEAPQPQPPPAGNGVLTLLIGDGPLDGVDEVIIDIAEIALLGDGEQEHLIVDDVEPLNLLALRNVTEVVAAAEVPEGTYSKIRLIVESLEIVDDGVSEFAQLPGNGKIDLNPQGDFEISAGEDLVVEIDFDLDRSVHIVRTGNSQYRFRPVVFVNVLDQRHRLRLTKLFGTVTEDDDDDGEGHIDLCDVDVPEDCEDVFVEDDALLLIADGSAPMDGINDFLDGNAHVFGHFVEGAQGGLFFRALAVVGGESEDVEQLIGEVSSELADGAFDVTVDEEADPVSVEVQDGAKLLDGLATPWRGISRSVSKRRPGRRRRSSRWPTKACFRRSWCSSRTTMTRRSSAGRS